MQQVIITLEGALKLMMWLSGDMAKDYRSAFIDPIKTNKCVCCILTRYLACDASMHEEGEIPLTPGQAVSIHWC